MTTTLTDHLVDSEPIVRGIVRSRLPERDVADVVQETLIGLWRHLTANELTGSSPHSLAATIAVRRCIDYYRNGYSRVVLSDLPDIPGPDNGPEGPLTLSAQLADLLAPLTDHQRRVLWLRVAEGRSSAEVAALLGTTPMAVRVVQHRALRQVRAAAAEVTR
jgi:RNA polymerase sigma-70 factor, ECF subfamily